MREATQCSYTPRPRAPAVAIAEGQASVCMPAPKQQYLRDEDYRRWVATLPCAHCYIEGYSQVAHSDDNGAGGKGMGIKSCDSTVYPACAPRLGEPGCHWRIGAGGLYPKDVRRELEAGYAAATWSAWQKYRQSRF